jgi:putative transposase
MTEQAGDKRVHARWARFRFSVIGHLLAAPPRRGELAGAITALAERTWQHPISGEPTRFGFSTIQRWYYKALKARSDPVGVLHRKLRIDAGLQPAISSSVRQALIAQYTAHKSWSAQLHHDNLVALAETNPDLLPLPSYATLRRFLKANGLTKRRRLTNADAPAFPARNVSKRSVSAPRALRPNPTNRRKTCPRKSKTAGLQTSCGALFV